LKATKEKQQVTCRGKSIRITADLSEQIQNAGKAWNDIFQALKENNC
jgi:uncharacterized protein (DUF4415 family)